jgi:hypothetical protein
LKNGDAIFVITDGVLLFMLGDPIHATIPSTVTKINYSVFADCQKMTQVDIPDTVTEIESKAFYGCTQL